MTMMRASFPPSSTRTGAVVVVILLLCHGVRPVRSQFGAGGSVTATLKWVPVGGCFDITDDVLIQCAAVEEECEQVGRVRFKRALELSVLDDTIACTTDKIPLGTCRRNMASGPPRCALTPDSCSDPADFVRAPTGGGGDDGAGSCNAEGITVTDDDGTNIFVPTQYGACKDGTTGDVTCVLTPADCTEREAWIPADVAEQERNGGCRCHDVRVGVCMGSNQIEHMKSTCAISVDDCHPLIEQFGSARDVLDHPLLDCRLCPYHESLVAPRTDVPTTNPTNNPTKAPTNHPTKNPTNDPAINPSNNPTKNPTNNPTTNPTNNPTKNPTNNPIKAPVQDPTATPTKNPTVAPTAAVPSLTTSDPRLGDASAVRPDSLGKADVAQEQGDGLTRTEIIIIAVGVLVSVTVLGAVVFLRNHQRNREEGKGGNDDVPPAEVDLHSIA